MSWVRRNMDKNKLIVEDNDLYSHLVFLTRQFQEDVFGEVQKTLDQEAEKRRMLEVKMEEELKKSREMKREASLDTKDDSSSTDAGGDENDEEVVQPSCQQNFPSRQDTMCLACKRRMANMIWFPCRHLSICNRCEVDATNCPSCDCKKLGTSMKISWPQS